MSTVGDVPYLAAVMPEGHTIHRAARDHARDFAGKSVRVTSPQGRFDPTALVDAEGWARLKRVEAYGKHLFYVFEPRRIVHVHLGLFGKFHRRRSPAPAPRSTTRMRLEGEAITLDLVGPTACELLSAKGMRELTARLGPDPLRDDADPAPFLEYLARSTTPIGTVLLDQSKICGVGNVYRAEILHLLRLHPDTPCSAIAPERCRELWSLIVGLLRRGVEEKRIVTTRGLELAKPRERVPRSESTYVYGRAACRTCGDRVVRDTLRARTIHWCETCQPLG